MLRGGRAMRLALVLLVVTASALAWMGGGMAGLLGDAGRAAASGSDSRPAATGRPPAGATIEDAARRLELSVERLNRLQEEAASTVRRLVAGLTEATFRRVTLAVGIGIDSQGRTVVVVGTSEANGTMRAGVRPLLGNFIRATGRRGAPLSGHAEDQVLEYMRRNKITPLTVAASRPICNGCAKRIWRAGATFATPLKSPVGVRLKEADNVIFVLDRSGEGPVGVHEDAVRMLQLLDASEKRGSSATTVVRLPASAPRPSPSERGLEAFVNQTIRTRESPELDVAARVLVRAVRARRASKREAKVTVVVRGDECLVLARAMKLARLENPRVGLAIDVAVLVDPPDMGEDFVSELGFGGTMVVVREDGGVRQDTPNAGRSPSSPEFNDTGQVRLANAGKSMSPQAANAAAARAASGTPRRNSPRGQPAPGPVKQRAGTVQPALAPAGGMASASALTAAQTPGAANLGGIDFSSLELRYVADASSAGTHAVAYAFKAVPGPGVRRVARARRAVRESSDAFFVWLALPKQALTVNLNPSEPNRIVDAQLGRTDAGRILLEADLRMKKTVARLIHPARPLGARFWRVLDRLDASQSARVCLSFRQWIVPGPATVNESRDELYILKAPLYVKMESDYRGRQAAGGDTATQPCAGQSEALEQRSEALYRRLILPRVQRAVRRAPEYAALRRVYLSRVAAEWYRRLGAREGGAFVDIIDSGDVSRWVSKRRWRPRDVFDRYVRSFRRGEFRVKRRTRQGNVVTTRTLVYGGVDFTAVPSRVVSSAELRLSRPDLPATLTRALSRPTTDLDGRNIWLAGASFDRTLGAADPATFEDTSTSTTTIILGCAVLLAILFAGRLLVRRRSS